MTSSNPNTEEPQWLVQLREWCKPLHKHDALCGIRERKRNRIGAVISFVWCLKAEAKEQGLTWVEPALNVWVLKDKDSRGNIGLIWGGEWELNLYIMSSVGPRGSGYPDVRIALCSKSETLSAQPRSSGHMLIWYQTWLLRSGIMRLVEFDPSDIWTRWIDKMREVVGAGWFEPEYEGCMGTENGDEMYGFSWSYAPTKSLLCIDFTHKRARVVLFQEDHRSDPLDFEFDEFGGEDGIRLIWNLFLRRGDILRLKEKQ